MRYHKTVFIRHACMLTYMRFFFLPLVCGQLLRMFQIKIPKMCLRVYSHSIHSMHFILGPCQCNAIWRPRVEPLLTIITCSASDGTEIRGFPPTSLPRSIPFDQHLSPVYLARFPWNFWTIEKCFFFLSSVFTHCLYIECIIHRWRIHVIGSIWRCDFPYVAKCCKESKVMVN